jgi:type 1 fimbria pilin
MKSKIQMFSLLAITLLVFFSSCKKDSGGQSTLKVRLTDAPADYQEVNIDLRNINVKLSDDSESWVELDAVPGIYNLLGLQNGVDTLIGTDTFPKGIVKEIRLVLGPDNTIKVNGTVFQLSIPSGSESGLKIKVDKKLEAAIETLIIDFDAALSIHEEGIGDYKLRPVLRIK